MDNNNPTIAQPEKENGAGKNMMWLVIGLILVILLIGGAYWYLRGQQTTISQPTPKASAQPTTESFDQDLNSIDVQTQDTEFDTLDKDLQSL